MDTRAKLVQFAWRTASFLWGIAALGVWAWTTRYEFTTYSHDESVSVLHWPIDTSLGLAEDRPTLVFFIHPRCPCTRASVRELERSLTGTGLSTAQQPKCIAVASVPPNATLKWRDTDIIRRVSALPQTEIAWDVGGVETARFGVVTSGAVRLFRNDGELLFAGGVTASRGHEGDNTGSDRIYASLSQQTNAPQESTPVFGCRLCVEPATPICGEACQSPQPLDGLIVKGASR